MKTDKQVSFEAFVNRGKRIISYSGNAITEEDFYKLGELDSEIDMTTMYLIGVYCSEQEFKETLKERNELLEKFIKLTNEYLKRTRTH